MKISLDWLNDYLPGPLSAEAASHALTHAGLPVETIERQENDAILDVEVTSNRGDCLSHVGVARELSALLDRPFVDVAPAPQESAAPAASAASVRIDASDLCPHYTARVIRGVRIGPSPDWLVRRLMAVGLRPINNVVDATNYVMFELGQPLHAFDFDKMKGGAIVVRRAAAGETLVTIDGTQAALNPDMLVIADAQRPTALAGVMGGLHSEVAPDTTTILLESARFDPLTVRTTARAIVRSESSYRFERGIDPMLPEKASRRAAELILQMAGGELLGGVVEAGAPGWRSRRLALRLSRLERLLGVAFPAEQVMDAFHRLRFEPKRRGELIEVQVPSCRLDLSPGGESDMSDALAGLVGEASLAEEAARLIGYDKIPVRETISIRVAPPQPGRQVVETLRSTLAAAGHFEAMTFSFVADRLADAFVPPEASKENPLPRAAAAVRAADARLRPSLLPGLLEAVRRNETAGVDDARLFEIGAVFHNDPQGRVVERQRIGWVGSAELRDVRGEVELLLSRLDSHRAVRVVPERRAGFAAGASGRIEWGDEPIGHLGLIEPAAADALGLRRRPAAAELDLQPLLDGAKLVPQLRPLPKFPSVRRDLSFVLSDSVRYDDLALLIRETSPPWMEDLSFVTTYRGKPLEKGTRSVTVAMEFRSPTETLTSEQVESAISPVVEAAHRRLGAALRT